MKALWLSLVILLTIYAPIELSRMIFAYGLEAQLIVELYFFWAFYLMGMFIIYRRLK